MKQFLFIATIILTILLQSACNSVRNIVIEVQKPAEITLPSTLKNIAIVDNSTPQPSHWGHYSLKNSKTENITVNNDSMNIFLMDHLFNNLIDLDKFENVSLYENQRQNNLIFGEENPLDSLMVKQICEATNADVLLSINRFIVTTISHTEQYDFDANINFLDLKIDVLYGIYSKSGNHMISTNHLQDSVYWESISYGSQLLSPDSIPSRENAVEQASILAAEKIVNSLIPNWVEENRVYYGDNKEANAKIVHDDWRSALGIWKNEFGKTNKSKKKARIASNIALAYELSDNLKDALRWQETAIQLFQQNIQNTLDQFNIKTAENYRNNLIKRIQDFKIMDSQE